MLSSLRARLLLWYTLILAVVIAGFAATSCYLFWRSLVLDIDERLRTSADTLVAGLYPTSSGDVDLVLPAEFRQVDGEVSSPATYYAVWNRDGELVDRSGGDVDVPRPAAVGMRTRAAQRELVVSGPGSTLVLIGRDLHEARNDVLAFAGTAAAGGLAALLVSLLGGWFLVGRALAPVTRISQAAAAMSAGDLDARIAVERTENELEQVAVALNQAFDRLQLAIEGERRFTADASHELRTPLATISAEIDWALARERSGEEYRRCLDTARRAADRMRRLVERLLTLARADSGVSLQRAPVGLAPIVGDALGIVRPLAEQKHVTIETHLQAATVVGDRDRLTDLVTNLFSNAIQYNRDGGRVSVEVWPEGADACVRVRDTGTGISEQDLPRVFDRFYRADKARAAQSGGAGLGLAIAKWIVEAHGGRIACQSAIGQGTEVLVRLPRLV
jgi:heavy metal sensor kinase